MFSLGKKEEGLHIIIDISSYSLGGALISFTKGKKPEVIFAKRISLPLNQNQNKDKAIIAIAGGLEQLFKILVSQNHSLKVKKIKSTLCVVSSPWCISKIKTVSLKKDKPIHTNEKLLSDIALQTEKTETGEYDLIEKKIIQTKLNGYISHNPLNKKVKEIELSTFEGKILKELADTVVKISSNVLSGNIAFHSFTLAAFATINEIWESTSDYLLMEITGDMTDLSLVKEGLIVKTASFPKGKNLFLNRVAKEFAVDADISLSFLKLYYERKSEEGFESRIKEIVGQAQTEWIETFRETFMTMKEPLPAKTFLAMDSVLSPYFAEYLKSELDAPGKNTDIIPLSSTALNQFCNTHASASDSFLALETIYFNKIVNSR